MRFRSVLLLLILCESGVCADILSMDPPDPRLAKKVTLEVKHTKLEDVATQLSEQTGIVIKAGSGARDWRVRERHVTIYAKDVELGKLMTQISKLLGYYVSREGKNDEWSYLYWQDAKSRMLESEMLKAEKEATAQRIKEYRQAALDDADKALEMTPEDARELREEDPWLAYLGGSTCGRGFAQILSALGRDFQVERDLMLRGRQVTIPISGLPANLQQAALDTSTGGLIAAEGRKWNEEGDLRNLQPSQIVLFPLETTEAGLLDMLGVGGAIVVTGAVPGEEITYGGDPLQGGQPMSMSLISGKDSQIAKTFGKFLFQLDEGADVDELGQKFEQEMMNPENLAAAMARKSPTEENPPTDPELTREIEIRDLKFDPRQLSGRDGMQASNGKVAAELCRALGSPVLLESFAASMPLAVFIRPGKQPFYKVLVALEKAGYSWEREDGVLRVRPVGWALYRSYEIPESFLKHYRRLLETQGEFTIDDLAEMVAGLSDDQILRTLASDPDLSFAIVSVTGDLGTRRNFLRLYGGMSPQQKAMLSAPDGLPFDQLTNQQWEQLGGSITDQIGGAYIVGGNIRKPTPGEQREQPSSPKFEIAVFVQGEEKPRVIVEQFMILGKEEIAAMKEGRKQQEEAAGKQEQESQPTSPP